MDERILLALYGAATAHPGIARTVTLLAVYGIFLLPLALASSWFWPEHDQPGRRQMVLAGGLTLLLASALAFLLGFLVDRPRPFAVLPITPLFFPNADPSFPSRHTLLGMALVAPLLWRSPRIGVCLCIWTLMVGLARVASGVHYLSDIIGGALLAMGVTPIVIVVVSFLVGHIPPSAARRIGLHSG